jgi:uncharacterized protein (TIGR00369 family)
MTDAELLATINRRQSPSAALFGMTVLALDSKAGTIRVSFVSRPEFCNPMGNVQGGFVVAMLDEAAAYAAIVHAGQRIQVPSIELKTSFFGPVRHGEPIIVEGRCLKLGKRVAFMEADMVDGAGKLLARLSTSAVPMALGAATLVEKKEDAA